MNELSSAMLAVMLVISFQNLPSNFIFSNSINLPALVSGEDAGELSDGNAFLP